jgi:hypothetical protein
VTLPAWLRDFEDESDVPVATALRAFLPNALTPDLASPMALYLALPILANRWCWREAHRKSATARTYKSRLKRGLEGSGRLGRPE